MIERRAAQFAALVVVALTASVARAQAVADNDRAHTLAQLGLGLLTIPGADVCLKGKGCTKGDTSLALEFLQLYRANRYFGIGAGVMLGVKPTVDNPPTQGGIERTHTRSYFTVEAQARYYAMRLDWLEAFVGLYAGGVVVSDRYTIEEDSSSYVGPQPAFIGPRQSTIRTEGLSIGGIVGGQWSPTPRWAFGATFRYGRWFLPSSPASTAFLDMATLTGSQGVLFVGLMAAYRIPL
jgi:hypothetical protein